MSLGIHKRKRGSGSTRSHPKAVVEKALAKIERARQGRRQEAAKHYAEALRLKPDYAEAKRQLETISAPEQK